MDLDGMGTDVRRLKAALARMESVIAFVEGLKAAGFDPGKNAGAGATMTSDQKTQVREQFSDIIGPISQAIDLKLNSFDDRLKQLEGGGVAGSAADISQRLTALEGGNALSEEDLRRRDRLDDMLTWFDANKEGLELLLSFDGEVDQISPTPGGTGAEAGNPQTGASNAHGLAAGAAETASGSVSGAGGTVGAGEGEGAHPGSFKELSQTADELAAGDGNTPGSGGPVGEAAGGPLQGDPATQADQANKEPVAGRDQV